MTARRTRRRATCVAAALLAAVAGPQATGEGLLQLYDHAIETNPMLRGSQFGVDEVRAQKDIARSQLLPQITADGSYDWNEYDEQGAPPERYEGTRGVLSARQALLDLPAYYRYRSARSALEQGEFERIAIEMEVAFDVVDRYLTVLQAEDELGYIAAEKTSIENQLQRLRFMRERQLAKVTDLYEVEAYYQSLLTREIEANNARAVSLARLRETTGLRVDRVERLARSSFTAVQGDEETWVRDALAANPNVLAMERGTESARRLVQSSRTQHLPRLALAGNSVYADQGFDNRAVPTYQVDSIGFEITVPIYEGGRVQAAVRESRARYLISVEQHEAARREIEAEAREAYLNAVAAHARTLSTAEETRALEKVVEAQQKSFERGVSTVLDVLIAQRRLTKARSDQSKAQYDYIRAQSTLRAQVGALGRSAIEEIYGWFAEPATVGKTP